MPRFLAIFTICMSCLLTTSLRADVVGITSLTFNDPDGDLTFDNTISLNSTTISGFGSVTNLHTAISVSPDGSTNSNSSDPNYINYNFVFNGEGELPVDYVSASTSLLDLSPATGLADFSTPVSFLFGTTLNGAAGTGNDIFLFDIGSLDIVTIDATDADGNVISSSPVSIATSEWGTVSPYIVDLVSTADDVDQGTRNIRGLAFDITDFGGDVSGQIAGIRISPGSTNFDLVAVGFTDSAISPIPEPSTMLLVGLSGIGAMYWRRRNCA